MRMEPRRLRRLPTVLDCVSVQRTVVSVQRGQRSRSNCTPGCALEVVSQSCLLCSPQEWLAARSVHVLQSQTVHSCRLRIIHRWMEGSVQSRNSKLMVRAAAELPSNYKTVKPVADRVFVKAAVKEEKTMGGILLPTCESRSVPFCRSGAMRTMSYCRWASH
jgi:hypothetical protein